MPIAELFQDNTKKAKEKVATIAEWLLSGDVTVKAVLAFCAKANDMNKGTCIEALEFATKQRADIADEEVLAFVTHALLDPAPRVKWESAKVIGNIAHLFPTKLDKAIANLLVNTKHDGTVVRWAAAFALAEILKLKTKHNQNLLPAIEAICAHEADNGIKKKYLDAIKKVRK